MRSGSVEGYGDVGGRLRANSVSLAAAGFFPIELAQEYSSFAFQVSGGSPSARSVLVGLGGKPEDAATQTGVSPNDVFDPTAFPAWKRLERPTRWVYVYVITATPGATLHVIGSEGEPVLGGGGGAAGGGGSGLLNFTQSTNAVVVMGAASALVLAANANRRAFTIENTGAVAVALNFGAGAAVFAADITLDPGQSYSQDVGVGVYAGAIQGITAGAAGELRVLEFA